MYQLFSFITAIIITLGIALTVHGQNPFFFTSLQLATDPDNAECLLTDGVNNYWGACAEGGGAGGDNVSIDSSAVTDPDFVSTGDIDFVNTSNTITANINAGSIIEPDLDADVAAADGDFLQYDSTGTNFTWRSASETKTDLSLNNVENTALSTWAGSTALTTVGTIGTGVWQATALTDTYVSDTLTIGAGSTVADGALSANVSLLGSTISASELAAADFGDFTVAASTASLDASTVSDNEIDYTTVTLADFTNDAGFVTSADDTVSGTELDGVFSTTGLLSRTGAGTYTTITDSSSNWNTAFGWGNHASAGYLDSGDIGVSVQAYDADLTTYAGITPSANVQSFLGAADYAAMRTQLSLGSIALLSSIDISSNTNLAAGRSLTMSGDSVEADAELYTDSKTIYFEDPTADDDFNTIWVAPTAVTITSISCESDQTVNFDLNNDDGTPTGVNGSDIACTTFATDSSLAGDTSLATGDRIDLAITSVSGTPTWVSITFAYTKND